MRILHCCLSCFYIDGFEYQENTLPRLNKEHGHHVEIIASTETYLSNGKLGYITPKEYASSDGIKVYRVPYAKGLPEKVMRKVRRYEGVYNLIKDFEPDVILFHGAAAYELRTVAKYKKEHPKIKLYVDSHEDYHNSGRNLLSKYILHRGLYRHVLKKSMSYIDKILFLTEENKEFITREYCIPSEKLEYFPLGGEMLSEKHKQAWRREVREKLNLSEDDVVIMHSGKLDKLKKTDVLINAFNNAKCRNLVLVIAGIIPSDNEELWKLVKGNEKIKWVGWLSADDMKKYMAAADVYAQPGSQSVTLQNAICCGLPIISYPHKSYVKLCNGNALWTSNEDEMKEAMTKISTRPDILNQLGNASEVLARNVLDYNVLARKIES